MPYFAKEEEQALFLFLKEAYRLNFPAENSLSASVAESVTKWFDLRLHEQIGFFSGAHSSIFIQAEITPSDVCYDIRPINLLTFPAGGALAEGARRDSRRFQYANAALDALSIYARQYYSKNNANKNLNALRDDRPNASLLNPRYYLIAFLCEAFDGLLRAIESKPLLDRCQCLINFLLTLYQKKGLYFKKEPEESSDFTRSIEDLFLYLIAEVQKIEKVMRGHLRRDAMLQGGKEVIDHLSHLKSLSLSFASKPSLLDEVRRFDLGIGLQGLEEGVESIKLSKLTLRMNKIVKDPFSFPGSYSEALDFYEEQKSQGNEVLAAVARKLIVLLLHCSYAQMILEMIASSLQAGSRNGYWDQHGYFIKATSFTFSCIVLILIELKVSMKLFLNAVYPSRKNILKSDCFTSQLNFLTKKVKKKYFSLFNQYNKNEIEDSAVPEKQLKQLSSLKELQYNFLLQLKSEPFFPKDKIDLLFSQLEECFLEVRERSNGPAEVQSPDIEFSELEGGGTSIESLCRLTYQVKDPEKLQGIFELIHDTLFQGVYHIHLKAGERAVSRYGQVKSFPKGISEMLNLMNAYFLEKPLSLDSLEAMRERLVIFSEEAAVRSSKSLFLWRDPSVQKIYDAFLLAKEEACHSLESQDGDSAVLLN